jgi:hypothetical protein
MNATLCLFGAFVFLAAFNAGSMLTLQIQHYGIYPRVGRDAFVDYIRANNRAALVPTIAPAVLLLVVSLVLVFDRPNFMNRAEAFAALALNLGQVASTFKWQRRLQAEMAETGYDDTKIRLLVSTNWIRTVAFLVQALGAIAIVLKALAPYAVG